LKSNEYRQKISALDLEIKEINHSARKQEEKNSILVSQVSHLENDRNNKIKESEILKERYENLKIRKSLLSSQKPVTDTNLFPDLSIQVKYL
jgi:hypothetical protein